MSPIYICVFSQYSLQPWGNSLGFIIREKECYEVAVHYLLFISYLLIFFLVYKRLFRYFVCVQGGNFRHLLKHFGNINFSLLVWICHLQIHTRILSCFLFCQILSISLYKCVSFRIRVIFSFFFFLILRTPLHLDHNLSVKAICHWDNCIMFYWKYDIRKKKAISIVKSNERPQIKIYG